MLLGLTENAEKSSCCYFVLLVKRQMSYLLVLGTYVSLLEHDMFLRLGVRLEIVWSQATVCPRICKLSYEFIKHINDSNKDKTQCDEV